MSNDELNNKNLDNDNNQENKEDSKSFFFKFFVNSKNNYNLLKEEVYNSNNSFEKIGFFKELIFYSIFNFVAPFMAINDTIKNYFLINIYNRIPKFLIKYQIYSFVVYVILSSIVYFFCQLIDNSKFIYYTFVIIFIIFIMKGYNRVVDNRRRYLLFIRNRSNIFGKFALASFFSKVIVFFIALFVGFNLPVYFYMLGSYLEFLLLVTVLFLFIYLSKLISNLLINYYISSYNDNEDFNKISKVIDIGNNENLTETNIFKKQKESRYNYYSLIISRRIASLLLAITFSYYYFYSNFLFTADEYKNILNLLEKLESNYIAYFIGIISNSLELFLIQVLNSEYAVTLPPFIMKYSLIILFIIYVVIGYGTFFGITSLVDFLSKEKYEFKEFEYVRNRKRISNFLLYSFLTIILFFSIFMVDNSIRNNMNVSDIQRTVLNLEDSIRKTLNMEYSEKFYNYSTNSNLKIEEEKIINHLIKESYVEFINKYKNTVELNPSVSRATIFSINIISEKVNNRIKNLENVMEARGMDKNIQISKIINSLISMKSSVLNNCEQMESRIVMEQGTRHTSNIRVFNKEVEYCMYKEFENKLNGIIKDLNLSPILNKY